GAADGQDGPGRLDEGTVQRRDRLRSASGDARRRGAVALCRRLLARPARRPPHRPLSLHADQLSAEFAAQRATGLAPAIGRARGARPAGERGGIRRRAVEPFGSSIAICNVLHGAVALFNEDMAMALCSAVNDWVADELLDREPRLRGSILVPLHNPQLAVA